MLADLILGHTPIVAVEWDAYACQVLRERAADGWFPGLHVWEGDVRMFDPSEYAGRVDCIHAGFPCQDISLAGNQSGIGSETRSGLYREVLRIASVVRPRYLFLENVAAIVTGGLDTVLADLAALGYDSEWLCLRASDCGANHYRDRWWLLADAECLRRGESSQLDRAEGQSLCPQEQREESAPWSGPGCAALVDANGVNGWPGAGWSNGTEINDASWWEAEPNVGLLVDGVSAGICGHGTQKEKEREIVNAANTDNAARQDVRCVREPVQPPIDAERTLAGCEDVQKSIALRQGLRKHQESSDEARIFLESAETLKNELRGMRPRKEVTGASHRPRQNQQRTEQHPDAMQTLPRFLAHASEANGECCSRQDAVAGWWEVEPNIGRVVDGFPGRVHRLKGLGNAQVPLQAAVAWCLLKG